MKKTIKIAAAAALFFVLLIVGAVSASADSSSPKYIKIGLQKGAATATVKSDSGLTLCKAGNNTVTPSSSGALNGQTTVALVLSGGKVYVRSGSSSGKILATLNGDGTECVVSAGYFSSGDYVTVDGKSYRGSVMPYINSSGRMNVLNYVEMDDYIRGNLHQEMSQSSNLEALKTQAIAARSYAESLRNYHKSQGCDLCNLSSSWSCGQCQSYLGVSGEYPKTDQAVRETAGRMMYYQGKVITAFYFANSGGHTENCEDSFVAPLGYLRGVRDDYAPDNSWSRTFTRSQLSSLFPSVGTVTSVSVDRYNESGYAASLTVRGSKGSVTKTKEGIRSAFSLKSRNFTFSTSGGKLSNVQRPSTQLQDNTLYCALSSAGQRLLGNTLSVISADGVSEVKLNGLKILDGSRYITTASLEEEPANALLSSTVTLSSNSDTLTINGKGWGHGVGLSQASAIEMGKQGFTCDQILHHFYTDVEIR
ncbi:MAG: SpoIID/LytB domain-containing protein [Firmicutes bacterium]|nr:SpoIID/LytB domain-containing protein [Bacillota bacterium]